MIAEKARISLLFRASPHILFGEGTTRLHRAEPSNRTSLSKEQTHG